MNIILKPRLWDGTTGKSDYKGGMPECKFIGKGLPELGFFIIGIVQACQNRRASFFVCH